METTEKQMYEAVKNFLERSKRFDIIRDIAIELLDGVSYEDIYNSYKDHF